MKPYQLFCMWQYYPCGGMNDHCGSFDTIPEAEDKAKAEQCDSYHVVDTYTWMIIVRG